MKSRLFIIVAVVVLLALPLSVVLAGGQQEADGAAGEQLFIGVSVPSADHGWTAAVIDYAEQAVAQLPIKGRVLTAADVNQQANDVEDLMAQDVDAIVILPLEGDPLTPTAKSVLKQDIALVNFDRELGDQAYTALVKGNNKGIGVNAGKWLVSELDGKGKVFMLSGPPCSVTSLRNEGFQEAIEGTEIEVVGKQDGGYQREKGYQVMQNALTANPEIDAVFSIDDEMSLGALQAIKEAGRTDIKYLTGAGGEKHFFESILNEDKRTYEGHTIEMATFLYQPNMIQDAVKAAMQIADDNPPAWYEPGENVVQIIPAAKVDMDNVKTHYDAEAPY